MNGLNLRQKLAVIVGTVMTAFAISSVATWFFDREIERQLTNIRDQYFPIIELGYRLDTEFEGLNLGFRDATSAQDANALAAVQETKNKLMGDLEGAKRIVNPQQIEEAKSVLEGYFAIALETSSRLIKSEAGTDIVEAMTKMQIKRAAAESILKKITNFDREKLSEAFSSTLRAQSLDTRMRFFLNFLCVSLIVVVSSLIWKDVVFKVNAITDGLNRFGAGDFKEVIPVAGNDELSGLGRQVNLMAEKIQSLLREIESFSYSVAHDLRTPLRSVIGFSTVLIEDHAESLNAEARSSLDRISGAAQRMGQMVDGLLSLSRLNRAPLVKQEVNLAKVASRVIEELKGNDPDRNANFKCPANVTAQADPKLLEVVMSNLLGNAWKFTKKRAQTEIEFGSKMENGKSTFFVRDNGAGFDMRYSDKLFGTFQRLHSVNEFEGHGIGLATVKSVINRHNGHIWAESEPDKGATFYFTLG